MRLVNAVVCADEGGHSPGLELLLPMQAAELAAALDESLQLHGKHTCPKEDLAEASRISQLAGMDDVLNALREVWAASASARALCELPAVSIAAWSAVSPFASVARTGSYARHEATLRSCRRCAGRCSTRPWGLNLACDGPLACCCMGLQDAAKRPQCMPSPRSAMPLCTW